MLHTELCSWYLSLRTSVLTTLSGLIHRRAPALLQRRARVIRLRSRCGYADTVT